MTFLVVGEALVDVVRRPDGSVQERPGGSPANVAVGLGRLGHEVTLLTALGDDARGQVLRDHLTASHVIPLVAKLPRTATAQATLDDAGIATYEFDIAWDTGDLAPSDHHSWLHVGSLGTTLQPGADMVLALVLDSDATVSFDPNCRPQLMGEAQAVLPRIEQLVARADIVKLSEEDASWLYPARGAFETAQRWLELGPSLVVVTRGDHGAVGLIEGGVVMVSAAPGGAVVDTVGAGDAFMSGLLDHLSQQDLSALDEPQVRQALDRASAIARRTCERVGADPPWEGAHS